MKKQLSRYLYVFQLAICLIANRAAAQTSNCYTQLYDGSGYPVERHHGQLNAAACALIAAFPREYQDSFQVYDFGFYLHNEVMAVCTSQYSTFSQKVSAFFGNASVQTIGYTLKIASSVEAFDGKETQWLNLSTFIESDSWFQQHIQKMYQAQQTGGQAALNTSFQFAPTLRNADWGLIPQGAITLDTGRTILYSVYQAIATDILDLNQQAKDWNERYTTNCMNAQASSSVCNNCCPTPAIVTEFMTKTMPTPPLNRYSVILRYAIPGMPGALSASNLGIE